MCDLAILDICRVIVAAVVVHWMCRLLLLPISWLRWRRTVHSTGFGSQNTGGGYEYNDLSSFSSFSSSSSQGAQYQRLNHQAWSPSQTRSLSKDRAPAIAGGFNCSFGFLDVISTWLYGGGHGNHYRQQQHLQPWNVNGMCYDRRNECFGGLLL